MKLTFTFKDEILPTLSIKAQGVEVDITFDGGEAKYVTLNGETEFETTQDVLSGLFVQLQKTRMEFEVVSLAEIVRQAQAQFDGIMEEVEQEDADEAAHRSYLSSPYQTGRV